MVDITTIETRRMLGRACSPDHLDDAMLLFGDPLVMRTQSAEGLPMEREAVAKKLRGYAEEWEREGIGLWSWWDRSTGEYVGRGGLARREVAGRVRVEVGWAVRSALWRRGFATEMGQAGLRVGFGVLRIERIFAITLPHNEASLGVMRRLGMSYERAIVHAGLDHVMWSIGRREGEEVNR
jgi:RimJ/RimL family protein N-acetyltransferase